jgi:hypothetical protein
LLWGGNEPAPENKMNALSTIDLAAAIESHDLRALAGHAAASALDSARENGAKLGADEREAAERLDEWDRLADIAGCHHFDILLDADLCLVARLAIAIIEGRV